MEEHELHDWWARGDLPAPSDARALVTGGDPVLASRHRVGEAAAAALTLGAAWAAELWHRRGGRPQAVGADTRAAAASLVGFALQHAPAADLGRRPPPFTRLYPTADGRWIHLHGGFPHLAAGLLEVLGCATDAGDAEVAVAVRAAPAVDLEDRIANARLCAAVARSSDEWRRHPQGLAVAGVGAVTIRRVGDAPPRPRPMADRPLTGVRVADLTRVLAGPTCGRTLASHGADVLRIGAAHLPSVEPYVVETGHGKRTAFVDLDDARDRDRFAALVTGADVFCQSYRHGALAARGFGPDDVAALAPGVVHVSINCYGHTGPWAARAGWEQLAQTATGIALTEGDPPQLIPAAATDYTTGYLAAAGALVALTRQMDEGGSWAVEASLCQTAHWLQAGGLVERGATASGFGDLGSMQSTVATAWGPLTHLRPVATMELTPPRWDLPPAPLGSQPLSWGENA